MNLLTRRHFGLFSGMAAAVALTAGAMISFTAEAAPGPEPGQAAPDFFIFFTATGETISLSDFSGQTVILEWTNHDCPFVIKHYAEPVRNMQTLQKDAIESGVVWLQVISSAPGKQGHIDGSEAQARNVARGASVSHTILDASGIMGRTYQARTTPHMFVINEKSELAYAGAIDSIRSARLSDLDKATNYVRAAMEAVLDEGMPEIRRSRPYGCSVKY